MLKKTITKRDSKGKILHSSSLIKGEEVPDGSIYCKACDTVNPLEEFSLDAKGRYGRTSTCKGCAAERARHHYHKRMESEEWRTSSRLKSREAGQERKRLAVEGMGGKCIDCGGTFHQSVYDFHHLDPLEKEGNPSSFLSKSKDRMEEELSKCVLLCANCHRIRHFKEGS